MGQEGEEWGRGGEELGILFLKKNLASYPLLLFIYYIFSEKLTNWKNTNSYL